MRVAVKSHALPVYKKNRIASLLCIFEITIADEIAEPRPDMNIKVAAFTVNEKFIFKKKCFQVISDPRFSFF